MDTAIQTTATGLGGKLLELLTHNVLWVFLCVLFGAVIGILAAEYAKRFRGLFQHNLSLREYRRRSQFIATVVGGTMAGLLAVGIVAVPVLFLIGIFMMVFICSALLSPILYDLVRRLFPKIESLIFKKLRGD